MTNKDEILDKIKNHKKDFAKFGITDIGLFGSYVRNEQNLNSDIDILIDFDPSKETFDNFMAVYDLLEKLFQNQKIEIVTKSGLSNHIGPKILKTVVYA